MSESRKRPLHVNEKSDQLQLARSDKRRAYLGIDFSIPGLDLHSESPAHQDFDLSQSEWDQSGFLSPVEDPFPDFDLPFASSDIESSAVENVAQACSTRPDAQPTEASSDQICFGMICNVNIRLDKTFCTSFRSTSSSSLNDANYSPYTTLQLLFSDKRCNVLSESGEIVATMNTKSHKALYDLHTSDSVRCFGTVSTEAWNNLMALQLSPTESKRTAIDVTFCGPREVSDDVATKLFRADYFLQDPHETPPEMQYRNPQCLNLPDESSIPLENATSIGLQPLKEAPENPVSPDGNMDSFFLDFDNILDVLASHEYLNRAPTTSQVRTELLDHQKEGLDFIRRRESGGVEMSRCLWEQDETEDGEPLYKHAITGERSQVPNDAFGGILADEMGLGKTLTILSAIAGSLDRAWAYARETTTTPTGNGMGIIAARSTLLLVPSTLLMESWVDEINKHIHPGSLSYYKYHGHSRRVDYPKLLQHDIVITTYGTVAADFTRNRSLLHQICWYRCILDEGSVQSSARSARYVLLAEDKIAHVIRNPATKQFHAVTSLNASLRWCLSATPIQNSLEDLASLVRFIKLPVMADKEKFHRYITSQAEPGSNSNRKRNFQNLQRLLGSICLRRNKGILNLLESSEQRYELHFTPTERYEYARITQRCREALDLAVSGHKVKEAHRNVLESLLRLRLFCNNGNIYDAPLESRIPSDPAEALSFLQQTGDSNCQYCFCEAVSLDANEGEQSSQLSACAEPRVICGECTPRYQDACRISCPFCEVKHLSGQVFRKVHSLNELSGNISYPTKLLKLCDDILEHQNEGKSVVFSFWKRSLGIAGLLLRSKGLHVLRVDGTLPLHKRRQVLEEFQTMEQSLVLLMTLGTGAVGLNSLSVAKSIHLLEPQWNPSIESQAIGRVVRLGQARAVRIVRYIVKNTVEVIVQNKQLRKLSLAKGGFKEKAAYFKNLLYSETDDANS